MTSLFCALRPRHTRFFLTALAPLTFSLTLITAPAFSQPPVTDDQTAQAATLARQVALRDAFVARIHSLGLTCPLAVPMIAVEDVPSFGNYDPANNTLRTSDWTVLKQEEQALFVQLAGPGADGKAVHAMFEYSVHQWIFIHEMGHWWQTFQHFNASHYEREYDANRISLAYWREVEPSLPEKMMRIFQSILDHAPSPLPENQPIADYFNTNYARLGPSPAYPWFMSRMNLDAYHEAPKPSFAVALHAAARP